MDGVDEEVVELFATLSKAEPWRLQRQYFPSKFGGLPAWLDPVHLPKESELKCEKCQSIMTFFLQIYAPDDLCEENDSFHRTVYLFVCQPCGNQWKAFRSQLARKNDFYDFHPSEDNIMFPDSEMGKRCCLACGLPSDNPSKEPIHLNNSKIQLVDTQDVRELHERCKIAVKHQTLCCTFDEWILNICEGEIPLSDNYLSHEKELYNRYLKEKKLNGEMMDESEEQAFESIQEENMYNDESFLKFSKKTTPNEVLYYSREGEPLWISDKTPRPVIIKSNHSSEGSIDGMPNNQTPIESDLNVVNLCENCGSDRSFEFQVLPQLLHYIKSDRVDFGSLSVYTCSKSCKIGNKYQREVVILERDYSLVPKPQNVK
ncbi:C-terminal putative domain protein [Theileria parva strain Muguga]|uniref:Programmed cell death protein 2 C-terminal domain-containing protein n=1 Tax=Theileria parva TaxID=5875 RepID=Q4N6T0_THEPA|nr:C-terminal putative domain protein [Theileria parva strain Muguga]EAN34328.1 C-terminal putative domain protein [Theileria parva strain Muguga]|eukprot:XP_766611.1 hypothetical protein [Theileria parva strain Muguga]